MPRPINPATTQAGQLASVIKEILAEDLGYAENEMAVSTAFSTSSQSHSTNSTTLFW